MIGNKGKGNKTLWLCGDGFTSRRIGLIQFLERGYTRDCLNEASRDIDEKCICHLNSHSTAFSLSAKLSPSPF
jgi:hypothetical protein